MRTLCFLRNLCFQRTLCFLSTLGAASAAWPQVIDFGTATPTTVGEGWQGFLNFALLGDTLLTLVFAAVLGAIISFHPRHRQLADTLAEVEAPKVYILYAVIGALIGILVRHYDLVVGFVIFGIGGLIRFRTILTSASLTGRVILVTLIGLACGLNLPHVAALTTAFAWLLIFLLEARVTYRVDVRSLDPASVPEAANAYRALFEANGCRVISVRQNPMKQRIRLLVVCPRDRTQNTLQEAIDTGISGPLRGAVDWESD